MQVYINIEEILGYLPERVIEVFDRMCFCSQKLGYSTYLVGGTVRDLLLGKPVKDLDITVVGDAGVLAKQIWIEGKCISIKYYPRFNSVTIGLGGGFYLDLVTARKEYYPAPAVLPEVEPSDLYHDMFRRDFTVNAMAVKIEQEYRGELIDYFNGLKDLNEGRLRVIHKKSFIDDPTRIFRCIRFKCRYGFYIEPQTMELMNSAIKEGLPLLLSNDRIFSEIELIFRERQVTLAIKEMEKTGLWELLFPSAQVTPSIYKKVERAANSNEDRGLYVALALLEEINSTELNSVFSGYSRLVHKLRLLRNRERKFERQLKHSHIDDYLLYSIYRDIDDKLLAYCMLVDSSSCYRDNLRRYIEYVKYFPFYIDGNTIKGLGVEPGPVYRSILEKARKEILTKGIMKEREQIEIVRGIVERGGGE